MRITKEDLEQLARLKGGMVVSTDGINNELLIGRAQSLGHLSDGEGWVYFPDLKTVEQFTVLLHDRMYQLQKGMKQLVEMTSELSSMRDKDSPRDPYREGHYYTVKAIQEMEAQMKEVRRLFTEHLVEK